MERAWPRSHALDDPHLAVNRCSNLRRIVRGSLTLAALLAASAPLRAQIVRFATDFPDGAGWTFDPGFPPQGPVWAVDATPASVVTALPYHSAPASLNFNNGTCYGNTGCLGMAHGNATSPAVDISAPSGTATLSFWCAYDTETLPACGYDIRRVRISNDGFQSVLLDQCVSVAFCGPPGQWHQHALALQPSWGVVQARFFFDTVDGMLNGGAGWFVDDLEIATECVPPATYCTAKVNSQGCTPISSWTGFPSPSQPAAFFLRATSVLNHKPGLLLYGYGAAAVPFQGGFLCVASPITRITVASSGGNPPPADCSGAYAYDFNLRIQSGADSALVPGEDVYAQYWSRDPSSAFGSGLSGGVSFVICP